MGHDSTLPELPREPASDPNPQAPAPAESGTWEESGLISDGSGSVAVPPKLTEDATGEWQASQSGTEGVTSECQANPAVTDGATGEWQASQPGTDGATGAWEASQSGTPEGTGEWQRTRPGTDSGAGDFELAPGCSAGEGTSSELNQAAGQKALPSAAPLGRFVLKNFHAKGGMGEVWVAEDTDIGRVVALKRIRGGREDKIDEFLHEAQITGQLEHPGVIPIHELGVNESGQPYYVMKFVHGRTLKEAIDEFHAKTTPPPSPPGQGSDAGGVPREVQLLRLLETFIHLCQTIAYAHSRNVLHRDIKPDNVMVGAFGETLVLDWGLAKIIGESEATETMPSIQLTLSGDTQATQFGSVKGTPAYFAPEVAEGRTRDIDQISDVYLLGGTLYHILTGKKPRYAPKLTEMLEMARKQTPLPPRKIDPSIPRPLEAICMKALAMRKQDRYPSAQALAEDVQRYLAGEPVAAYRETLAERAWRWIRRHRVFLGRVAVLLLVVGLVGYSALTLRAMEERRQAEQKQAADDLEAANIKAAKEKQEIEIKAAKEKQEIEEKRAAAQREADHRAKVDKAKASLQKFRQHAEEMRFFNVIYDNPAEREPMYGRAKAEQAGRHALAALDPWGKHLENLPPDKGQLDKEKVVARQELYELLLLLAHMLTLRDQFPETAKEVLALLDHAAGLQPPSAGVHQLRAAAYGVLKLLPQAADEQLKATHRRTQRQALDEYLVGEQKLFDSLRADTTAAPGQEVSRQAQLCGAAIEHYYKAVQMDPEFVWAYWQMGRCFLLLQKKIEAGQSLAGCAALRPVSACGHTIRGVALVSLNRFDEATAAMTRGIEMDDAFRPARLQRGWVYWLQKEFDRAKDDFDAVLVPPEAERLPVAAYFRGQLHLEKKEYKEALKDFDLVTTGATAMRDAHLKRAKVCFLLGKTADGLKSIDAFLQSGRDGDVPQAEVHEFRGRQLVHLAEGLADPAPRLKQAALELQEAIGAQANSATLWAELGLVQDRLANFAADAPAARKLWDAAIDSYTRALQLAPDNVLVLVKRGWARDNTGADPAVSAADFAAALRLDPRHAEAHTGLGYMVACLKKSGLAMRHANLALLHGGGDYLVLHNVACIWAKLSESDADGGRRAVVLRRIAYEDTAIDLLRRGVELWSKTKRGANAIEQIRNESAFTAAMKARPDFKKLLEQP